jgi:predicted metalloendopeptidase
MSSIEKWAGESLLHHNARPGDAALELLRCLRADGGYPQTVRALDALVRENADLRESVRQAQEDLEARTLRVSP